MDKGMIKYGVTRIAQSCFIFFAGTPRRCYLFVSRYRAISLR